MGSCCSEVQEEASPQVGSNQSKRPGAVSPKLTGANPYDKTNNNQPLDCKRGACIVFSSILSGSIFLYYRDDVLNKDNIVSAAGECPMIIFNDIENLVPNRKFPSQEKIGEKIGANLGMFYKYICAAIMEARKHKMRLQILDPQGAPSSINVVILKDDETLCFAQKPGDVIEAEILKYARAVAVTSVNYGGFLGVKTANITSFMKPNSPQCACLELRPLK